MIVVPNSQDRKNEIAQGSGSIALAEAVGSIEYHGSPWQHDDSPSLRERLVYMLFQFSSTLSTIGIDDR